LTSLNPFLEPGLWGTPVIPTLGRLRQEDGKFEASRGPIQHTDTVSKKKKKKKKPRRILNVLIIEK
jgi:hypothetical protein